MTKQSTTFTAIGTTWSIITSGISPDDWTQLMDRVQARVELFDKTYSRFRSDSWVTKLSQKAGKYTLPDDALPLIKLYENLYKATRGRVTPLIGQVISDAGYDANYSFQAKPMAKPPAWHDVIAYKGGYITIKQPALLDFGAAGKGYLVDIVGSLLNNAGCTDYVIDASGDILHRSSSKKPISVGLENPLDMSQAVGIAKLNNSSLCASSGSRRNWGKYTHILDPISLESPKEIIATWVIAKDTMTADGLSTALFFTDPANLKQFDSVYAILHKDMQLEYSKNFPAEIFEATSA